MIRLLLSAFLLGHCAFAQQSVGRPNIILLMSDDQGWGEAGYQGHPVLRTPELDAMAAAGLRMNHFYASAPVCSPTRAGLLTGRNNDRTAVFSVGRPMRLQETTIADILRKAGYATAHFGKWHLSGYKGPGVPVLASDPRHPGHFGYDYWLATTNFFDINPMLGRNGQPEAFTGGPSAVVIDEAIRYIDSMKASGKPIFMTIWFGSPHDPWQASDEDRKAYQSENARAQHHYGEITEMDRSIGNLRRKLRSLGIADNTILWFNSDNGGVKPFAPAVNGGLRGFKSELYEGGIRVPCIIEWPNVIRQPRSSDLPASVLDILPTLAEVAGIEKSLPDRPLDGMSLMGLLQGKIKERVTPIPFRYQQKAAWVDYPYKLVSNKYKEGGFELYHLKNDPNETTDLSEREPAVAKRMTEAFFKWSASVEKSIAGKDYPEGLTAPDEPSKPWMSAPAYRPWLEVLMKRPEYKAVKVEED